MPVPALVHRGIAYTDSAALGAALTPAVAAALDEGRAVTVALEPATAESLRQGLGGAGLSVEFLDITRPARQDAFQLAARRATAVAQAARLGVGSLLITEHADHRGRPDAYWLRLEAALDAALARLPVTLWCAYLADEPAYVQCHPELGPLSEQHRNPDYRTPPDVVHDLPGVTVPPPPAHATHWDFGAADLGPLRRQLAAAVGASGLDDEAGEDLVYSCSEVATNAVEHGGGTGTVWTWADGDDVVCQVADTGRVTDPFPGVVPPALDQDRGRGLWLARALCDDVDVASGPGGTVVRLARRRVRSEPISRQVG
ncbi:ATP-binding protein [Actinomycetospora sp. OC33-EN08]|uniref:ATP-binding protein n=1 Tax=Actinomycetospora aurantiaca TaxID=3129233 RepID=A0ABU8MIY3_9PSEU